MEVGIDSFAALLPDRDTGRPAAAGERMASLLAEIETADRVGLDVFGIGEHHREEYLDSAPAVILAAAAARTTQIRLTSAVAVLSAADPVRVFQEFATLDLISMGRAEIVVGRGSSTEAFPLFGWSMSDYDALFAEKLDLLLRLREQTHITWQGRFRPALTGQGVFPRPYQDKLPVWLGVGGTPESFVRAGTLGLPLMIAIIGGGFARFRPLVDLYREAGRRVGHTGEVLKVGVHALGFVADTAQSARDLFFPGWEYMFGKVGRERGLATTYARSVRRRLLAGGRVSDRRPRSGCRARLGHGRGLGQRVASHFSDDFRHAGACGNAALHRTARHPGSAATAGR
jgi:probable LLM family oxidoreductase